MTWRNDVLSRYRCRDCMLQFWVISRKVYVAAVFVGVAIAVAALVVFVLGLLMDPESTSTKSRRRTDAGQQQHVQIASSVGIVVLARDRYLA